MLVYQFSQGGVRRVAVLYGIELITWEKCLAVLLIAVDVWRISQGKGATNATPETPAPGSEETQSPS